MEGEVGIGRIVDSEDAINAVLGHNWRSVGSHLCCGTLLQSGM